MGTGTSPMGKGGGGGAKTSENDMASLQAINPDKPFSKTDFTTWKMGTEVEMNADDISAIDKRSAVKRKTVPGIVTEVHPDHVIVTTEDGTTNWIDDGLDAAKAVSDKTNAIPTSKVSFKSNGTTPDGFSNYPFEIGGKKIYFSGQYDRAKQRAINYAAAKGIRSVKAL